mmetsp:Transcript_7416/g.21083  ORF Transcript_7416/g.21083 Transcript_7416/m.21083 type:complete len:802 (-) Transcript_7416:135-2540(-)|eukprot:CAMPEP_0119123714 /NCGR_PEP_ID=MMETSP1310-20130426/3569_1 /TAXON_ID=464262 /ORGANISM="Genus nov. species nov., Strain RCC2339" /LENGTH=801 /DNA_ID=CAMNT_0007113573 /DNA_START=347 /DNA_END=2752 /DNA_ORIENTATION=+
MGQHLLTVGYSSSYIRFADLHCMLLLAVVSSVVHGIEAQSTYCTQDNCTLDDPSFIDLLDNGAAIDMQQPPPTAPPPEPCEINMEFKATDLNSPQFQGTFAIFNNGFEELQNWHVVWTFPFDKVLPGSVGGAILVDTIIAPPSITSVDGRPTSTRVVNTVNNGRIPAGSSKAFDFQAVTTLVEYVGTSRVPTDVSVNGNNCIQVSAGGECVAGSEELDINNSTCTVLYCCGRPASELIGSTEDGTPIANQTQVFSEPPWQQCPLDRVNGNNPNLPIASITNVRPEGLQPDLSLVLLTLLPNTTYGFCSSDVVSSQVGCDKEAFHLILSLDSTPYNLTLDLDYSQGRSNETFTPFVRSPISLGNQCPSQSFSVFPALGNLQWVCIEVVVEPQGRLWDTVGITNHGSEIFNTALAYIYRIDHEGSFTIGGSSEYFKDVAWTSEASIACGRPHQLQDAESGAQQHLVVVAVILVATAVFAAIVSFGCLLHFRKARRFQHLQGERRGINVLLYSQLALEDSGKNQGLKKKSYMNIDFEKDIVLDKMLGSGSFGTVHSGRWEGRPVAVKIMHSLGTAELKNFRKEIDVLQHLRHPRITSFLGACLSPPHVCLVEELALGGSLSTCIHQERGSKPLPYFKVLQLGIDVADAMTYLHPTIVHRDLKPQNVLLDEKGRGKVCDFGIASFKDRTFLTTRNVQAGTPSYMAPELFSAGAADEKCDVFSFGILLWECISGQIPWGELSTPMQVIFAVGVQKQRLPIPHHCPPGLRDLIRLCWKEDPRSRPPFSSALDRLLLLRRIALRTSSH